MSTKELPASFMLLISFEEDIHESFTAGLRNTAMDNLGAGVKVVEG